MNQKLCKRLRREAEFRAGVIPTVYAHKKTGDIQYFTGKITDKGLPEFILIPKFTTRMDVCTRKVYKTLKKHAAGKAVGH